VSDVTANKHGGNPNSVAAYAKGSARHECERDAILAILHRHPFGLTSKEIGEMVEKPLHAISGRFSELKQSGKIYGTGERRKGAEVLVTVQRQGRLI